MPARSARDHGLVIDHSEGVLSNAAHLDPDRYQIPGTPFEPEAMIVAPFASRDRLTLNVGRMGDADAGFSQNEFELVQLFAGQASLALENAEAHGAITVRAEHDALTGLATTVRSSASLRRRATAEGPRRSADARTLDSFKAFNDTCGHPPATPSRVRCRGDARSDPGR